MKKHELTPLEQILNDTMLSTERRMWDSLTEVLTLEKDIEALTEFLPRIKAISQELASLQVEMASIRIDMEKRKPNKKK